MEIEFTTPRGALIKVVACKMSGFHVYANGKKNTDFAGDYSENASVGPHVKLAGNGAAQIPAQKVAEVREWFAAAKAAQKEARDAYKLTDSEKDDAFAAKFYRKNSNL